MSFLLITIGCPLWSQVHIDKPINLTGASGDRSIQQLELPINGTDAANKDYVDQAVAASGGGGTSHGSASGTSVLTAYMDSVGLFSPHDAGVCDGTEAFVALFPGSTKGYCIEKNERTALFWTDAVRTCLSLGKRLPEAYEWQVACDNAGGLGMNDMLGNYEWAGNFAVWITGQGVGIPTFGGSTCGYSVEGWLAINGTGSGNRSSQVFRCVR